MPVVLTVIPYYTVPGVSYAECDKPEGYDLNETAVMTAFPAENYYLDHWERASDGKCFSENPLKIAATDDDVYKAVFCEKAVPTPVDEGDDPTGEKPVYNVTTAHTPVGAGTTSGDGEYEQGDTCTISATATDQDQLPFIGWTNGDWSTIGLPANTILTQNPYSFEVFDDSHYVAIFAHDASGYVEMSENDEDRYRKKKRQDKSTITIHLGIIKASDNDQSSATGAGHYYAGQACTLQATPDTTNVPGNRLLCFKRTLDSNSYSIPVETRTSNPYSFTVYPPDQWWWAVFGTNLVKVSISSNLPLPYSSGTGGSCYLYEDDITSLDYYKDITRSSYDDSITGVTVRRNDIDGLRATLDWFYGDPSRQGQYSLYYPKYIIEKVTGKRIDQPLGSLSYFISNCTRHYSGNIYYVFEFLPTEDIMPESNEQCTQLDFYVHFVQVGKILRNSYGNVLRQNNTILRAAN